MPDEKRIAGRILGDEIIVQDKNNLLKINLLKIKIKNNSYFWG